MATNKKKKAVKMQDMKPAKDAKGGVRAPVRQRAPVADHRYVAGRTVQ
jgi:hypothetical protein